MTDSLQIPAGIAGAQTMERFFHELDRLMSVDRFRTRLFAVPNEDLAKQMVSDLCDQIARIWHQGGLDRDSLRWWLSALETGFHQEWLEAQEDQRPSTMH